MRHVKIATPSHHCLFYFQTWAKGVSHIADLTAVAKPTQQTRNASKAWDLHARVKAHSAKYIRLFRNNFLLSRAPGPKQISVVI